MKPLAIATLLSIGISAHIVEAQTQQPEDKNMCKYGAEHMIDIAKQSLLEKSSRPERIEKRRKLVEEWSSRMDKGEDPCEVYKDIQKSAATF